MIKIIVNFRNILWNSAIQQWNHDFPKKLQCWLKKCVLKILFLFPFLCTAGYLHRKGFSKFYTFFQIFCCFNTFLSKMSNIVTNAHAFSPVRLGVSTKACGVWPPVVLMIKCLNKIFLARKLQALYTLYEHWSSDFRFGNFEMGFFRKVFMLASNWSQKRT